MSKPTVDDLIKLRKQGMSTDKIARLYGIPYKVVKDLISSTVSLAAVERTYQAPESLYQAAVRLWRRGHTQQEISDELGIPVGSLAVYFVNKGLRRQPSRDLVERGSEES